MAVIGMVYKNKVMGNTFNGQLGIIVFKLLPFRSGHGLPGLFLFSHQLFLYIITDGLPTPLTLQVLLIARD